MQSLFLGLFWELRNSLLTSTPTEQGKEAKRFHKSLTKTSDLLMVLFFLLQETGLQGEDLDGTLLVSLFNNTVTSATHCFFKEV